MKRFSHEEYKGIINHIKRWLPIVDFREVDRYEKYAVIRHDIEFSPYRALDIANLESELGITSTYFFQITNNCYNSLSMQNLSIIKRIHELGHSIGAHINTSYLDRINTKELTSIVQDDINTLSSYTDIDIDIFSFHRPTKEQLACYLEIEGCINAYGKQFFQYCNDITLDNKLEVTYLADSNHQWKYGHPLDVDFASGVNKLQLNTHPFSWTKYGFGNINNFKSLVAEKNQEMISSIDSEIKNFPQEIIK
tara:strand:- start:6952 stop:7704 length:753 start_codon:yes stop_codon:yes gene_type:complete